MVWGASLVPRRPQRQNQLEGREHHHTNCKGLACGTVVHVACTLQNKDYDTRACSVCTCLLPSRPPSAALVVSGLDVRAPAIPTNRAPRTSEQDIPPSARPVFRLQPTRTLRAETPSEELPLPEGEPEGHAQEGQDEYQFPRPVGPVCGLPPEHERWHDERAAEQKHGDQIGASALPPDGSLRWGGQRTLLVHWCTVLQGAEHLAIHRFYRAAQGHVNDNPCRVLLALEVAGLQFPSKDHA
jgi:hypothetical protein